MKLVRWVGALGVVVLLAGCGWFAPSIARGIGSFSSQRTVHLGLGSPAQTREQRYTVRQVEKAFRLVGLQPVAVHRDAYLVTLSFAKKPAVLTADIAVKQCLAVCVYPRIARASMETHGNVAVLYSRSETTPARIALSLLR